jgi:hypothetical protein
MCRQVLQWSAICLHLSCMSATACGLLCHHDNTEVAHLLTQAFLPLLCDLRRQPLGTLRRLGLQVGPQLCTQVR